MRTRSQGFTLIEILIVIAILAILATIAFPAYQEQLQSTRRAEGIALLNEVMQAQEREFVDQRTYQTDLSQLGYSAVMITSENGYYLVTATTCGADAITVCVELAATGIGLQTGTNLMMNSRGTKTGF